jgi:hypothetical protein
MAMALASRVRLKRIAKTSEDFNPGEEDKVKARLEVVADQMKNCRKMIRLNCDCGNCGVTYAETVGFVHVLCGGDEVRPIRHWQDLYTVLDQMIAGGGEAAIEALTWSDSPEVIFDRLKPVPIEARRQLR